MNERSGRLVSDFLIIGSNTSFQRTRVRGGRGLGPLNSKR